LNTTDTFSVDTQALAQAVNALRDADSQEAKCSSLETLTRLLFEGIPFLGCKHVNTEPIDSEIEVVVQYNGRTLPTVFDAFGRYFLLHGKDWNAPVRAKDLTALVERMQKSRVKLGFMLAPTGICGRRKGGQAVREMRRAFDVYGVSTVILCAEHLSQVVLGANFYDMLDYLIERTRFDFI
jgi:hypothetical protein